MSMSPGDQSGDRCTNRPSHARLRSPYRPLSATEDGDQSRRIPYLSEAWTFWPRKEAAGVADAMIKAACAFTPVLDTASTVVRDGARRCRGAAWVTCVCPSGLRLSRGVVPL